MQKHHFTLLFISVLHATLLLPMAYATDGIASISAGWDHTCAVTSQGGAKCWGYNDIGQLGNAHNEDYSSYSTFTVNVFGLESGVKEVAAGNRFSCALLTSGGVRCWGSNQDGRLGGGLTGYHAYSPTPVDVIGLNSGVTKIAVGSRTACAVLGNGDVMCWGDGSSGELGNGSYDSSDLPIRVVGLGAPAISVAVGTGETCVLLNTGGVKCWGEGMLVSSLTPVDVEGLTSGVSSIFAGGFRFCAILQSGDVKCWGGFEDENYGLGDGTDEDSSEPVNVVGLGTRAIGIALGTNHSCVLLDNHSVKCWGNDEWGELGNGDLQTSLTPTNVENLSSGVLSITSFRRHTCALLNNSEIHCWGGLNQYRELGRSVAQNALVPEDVTIADSGFSDVGISYSGFTCGLTTDSGIKCWGHNAWGSLGNESNDNSLFNSVDVSGLQSNVLSLSVGEGHSCAIVTGGGVKCWGSNNSGQLGDGSNSERNSPVNVSGLSSGVLQVITGSTHSCALLSGGGVKCWGDGSTGQLGDGNYSAVYTPVDVLGLTSGVDQLYGGFSHTCARLTSGGFKCWGYNQFGQLGDGTASFRNSVPVSVSILGADTVKLSTGYDSTCSLSSSGIVKCWGRNSYGELGNYDVDNSLVPLTVPDLPGQVKDIASGAWNTCAITVNGALYCWGLNQFGPLGNGTNTLSSPPLLVSGLNSNVESVSMGTYSTCAVMSDSRLKCWGRNTSCELGVCNQFTLPDPVTAATISGEVRIGSAPLSGAIIDGGPNGTTSTDQNGHYAFILFPHGNYSLTPRKYGYAFSPTTVSDTLTQHVSHNFAATRLSTYSLGGQVTINGTPLSGVVVSGNGELGTQITDSSGRYRFSEVPKGTPYTLNFFKAGYTFSSEVVSGAVASSNATHNLTASTTLYDVNGSTLLRSSLTLRTSPAAFSLGMSHTCAVAADGRTLCWGSNYYGELGNGTTHPSSTPLEVSGLDRNIIAISSGNGYTCALSSLGAVKCWGSNYYGQLGDGTNENRQTPVQVTGLESGVQAISASQDHACALLSAGGIKCWGSNREGQLGDGSKENRSAPVPVVGLSSGAAKIDTGPTHSCATLTNGKAKCWGSNVYGELGGESSSQDIPVDVTVIDQAISAVSPGLYYTCALLSNGAPKCFGYNYYGTLGNGTEQSSLLPVDVYGLNSGVAKIVASQMHTCALTNSGAIKCWGDNFFGELGVADLGASLDGSKSSIPVDVLDSGIIDLELGPLSATI